MAYWSVEERNPHTYHTWATCPSGRRIKLDNLWIGSPPGEWTECAICRRLRAETDRVTRTVRETGAASA